MVVDDRWENRAVFVNLLESLGFEVVEAINGQQGLEYFNSLQLDLLITDLVMPVMDGFEMLEHIRHSSKGQDSKIIVSSASVSQLDQQMAIDAGGNAFLPKPVDIQLLLQLIAQQLNLTWCYEKAELVSEAEMPSLPLVEGELLLPAVATLQLILQSAQRGRARHVRQQLEALLAEDLAYEPFVAPLLESLSQFNLEEIEIAVQKYL